MQIAEYITEVNKRYKTGISREHSYRGDLQTLVESLVAGIIATNEPARISCGAPDYVITKSNIPLGYIEAKDLDDDLDNKNHKEQFDRYRNSLNNLIITNYLEFRFYRDGEKVATVRIGHIENGKVVANPDNFQTFNDLIVNFCAYKGQTIRSASKLAKMMAGKARLLADVIKKALESTDESYDNRTLQDQMSAFQKILISDISEEDFADVYAQTIAYGMFAGRLNDTSLNTFSRQEACECIPKSNPFLRNLFGYIAGPMLDDRIKWIVDDLADIFVAVNLADILKDFGKATKTQDPIIHFYETFLSEYDPKLRKSRGVWYTPQPVVNFIVRAVDDILKNEFGLSDGLADTSKITLSLKDSKYGTTKKGDKLATIKKDVHRVQILDPATGTGTFLAEVVRQIHEKFITMQGMWSNYVEQHLIPRLHGFEILMASYAMAHLKLNLMLKETGYKATQNDRLKVYLTNSLEEPHPDSGTLFANWLSQEANEANEVKREVPVMVVLGNPPYSVSSSNKGEWITNLCDVYKKDLNERNIQPLSDDYIKFIRYGQYFVDKNNEGVLAYISNNSFIDGIIHRQMRKSLLETFDKIYLIDLHGNSRKNEVCPDGSKDENVFDIMQGVSINLFVKTNKKRKNQLAEVYHYDLYGKRESKYEFLTEHSLKDIDFNKLEYQTPYYFFVKKNFGLSKEYDKGFSILNLFKKNSVGIATGNDNILIQDSIDVLSSKMSMLSQDKLNQNLFKKISYRPFDIKYTYYSSEYVQRLRNKIMSLFLHTTNYGLVLEKATSNSLVAWKDVFISTNIIDKHLTGGASYIFPLYIYEDLDNSRHPNFDNEIIQKFADGLKLKFVEEKPSPLAGEGGTLVPDEGFYINKANNHLITPLPNPLPQGARENIINDTTSLSQGAEEKICSHRYYAASMKELSRSMRHNQTLQELKMWQKLRNNQLGFKFKRQFVISNKYIADFVCLEKRLIIEIDGSQHSDSKKDNLRTMYLQDNNFRVIRFWNNEVDSNLDGCLILIKEELEKKEVTPLPNPLPQGARENVINDTPPLLQEEQGNVFAPIDVLDYIYAVLHSPKYRETYKEFLKIDFPKVPYPTDKEKFWKLVALGTQIREIHLLESNKLNTLTIGYPISGDNIVTKLSYTEGKVFINDTQYFDNIPEVAWNFYIGGYQPAQKWLKDRKNKELSFDDIKHYQKIINALYQTNQLMQQVDEVGVI